MISLRTYEPFKNSYCVHYYYIIIMKNTIKKYSILIHKSIEIEFIFKHYLF